MLFAYKALDRKGMLCTGQAEATDATELDMRLKSMELELIHCSPRRFSAWLRPRRVAHRELINFCFHLEHLTRAGVPIIDGLRDLCEAIEAPAFRQTVSALVTDVEGGQTISQAMARHPAAFAPVFISLIRAGEESGQLPETLASLGDTLKWEDELNAQARKLLIYPGFVASIILAATVFLMLYMVPQLKSFIASTGQALPLQTRLLFALSTLIGSHWPLLVASPILVTAVCRVILNKHYAARLWLDGIKLKLPILGPSLQKIALSRFANTFAMLYGSGISVLEAIATTQSVVANEAIRVALQQAEQSILEGDNIAGAFQATGLFPSLVIRMLQIGESTGRLDTVLRNVSYFYNRDVKTSIDRLHAMIEPCLTLLLGALLGWIMLALIGPIYDVVSQVTP